MNHRLAQLLCGTSYVVRSKQNVDVTISLKEIDAAYIESLDHSIRQADEEHNLISFTMEDFMAYTPKKDAFTPDAFNEGHL